MLAEAAGVPVRNVAVDRGALKDDRNTNAEELYREAEKLAQDLKNGPKLDEPDEDYAAVSKPVRQRRNRKNPHTMDRRSSHTRLREERPASFPYPRTDASEPVM